VYRDKAQVIVVPIHIGAAFGHYLTKIKALMEAFATTWDFALKGEGETLKLVLLDRGKE
jgi:hypothetical protein